MNRISLASGVVPEFGPIETIDAAEAGGFDDVGLWIETKDWTPKLTADARARLKSSGLGLRDVEVIWFKPGAPDPDHLRAIDIGLELGAPNVLCVSSDPDDAATAAKLAALCERAAPGGMRVCLEFLLITEVKSIGQALGIIDQVRHPLMGLLIDPLHLARSGGSPADVAKAPRHLFPYAQFCDAVANGPAASDFDGILSEAIDGRLQCGEGGLPLTELLGVLPAGIPLSIELRSKALRDGYLDPRERARVTAEATRRFLGGAAAAA